MLKKVLIIDDSPASFRHMQSVLDSAGYRSVGLHDPGKIEEMIAVERPSVILLDVVMPVRNGFQVCRELKSQPAYANIPVILVSSKSTPNDKYWGARQGAAGYLTKPFTQEELLRAVEKFA